MTRLCVPIFVRSVDQARRDALVAVERGAELIELRLDTLPGERLDEDGDDFVVGQLAELIRRLRESNVRCILTLRAGDEGGKSDADDETRFMRLAHVASEAPSVVDLEWRPMTRAGGWPMALLDLAADASLRFIVSAHDFQTRPDDLLGVFSEMSQSRADVVKVAWCARSIRDNVEAFELLREAAKPSVALCMGEAGLPSRILAKKFNAYLTFASLSADAATADGQLPIDVLKGRYRWDSLGRATSVYGVVGHPIAHSRSPHVHNAAFGALGHDGVYLPLLVEPGYESFKAFMETWMPFEPLDLRGLSITLPHKENALRYAREVGADVDHVAGSVGSVNTFAIDPSGNGPRLVARNTDFGAILATVAEAQGMSTEDLRGTSVGVLGAGGTGRTTVAAFASLGCDVTVYNRTRSRADDLAEEFNGVAGSDVHSASTGDVSRGEHRVWVNTTSLGMSPNVDASAFGDAAPASLSGDALVFDTIYAPRETKLLRQAQAAGARTVNGARMFLHQAAAQCQLWTGQEAPLEVMRDAFEAD